MYKGDLLYDNALTPSGQRIKDSARTVSYMIALLCTLCGVFSLGWGIYTAFNYEFHPFLISIFFGAAIMFVAAFVFWARGKKRAVLRVYEQGVDMGKKEKLSEKAGEFVPFKNMVRLKITANGSEGKEHLLEFNYAREGQKAASSYPASYFTDLKLFINCLEGHVPIEREKFPDGENEFGKIPRKGKGARGKVKGAGAKESGSGVADEKDVDAGEEEEVESSLVKVETHSKVIYKDTNITCPKCNHSFTRTFEVDHLVNKSATISCPKCRKIFERTFTEADL